MVSWMGEGGMHTSNMSQHQTGSSDGTHRMHKGAKEQDGGRSVTDNWHISVGRGGMWVTGLAPSGSRGQHANCMCQQALTTAWHWLLQESEP